MTDRSSMHHESRVPRLVVGIATTGRRDILARTLEYLLRQSRLPDEIILAPAEDGDIDEARLAAIPVPVRVQRGPKGASSQRNAILDAAPDSGLIVFFDDDFLPAGDFLAEVEQVFERRPDLVAATGTVLADGATGPGISFADGLAIIAAAARPHAEALEPIYNTYGCNMAFRLDAVQQAERIRFDTLLPLYSWQEDVDFSRRLAPRGAIMRSNLLQGVHLGTKSGRTSGLRFGYSQIANPVYLARKGTVSWRWALRLMARNLAANVLHSVRPEDWVDRRGRLKGNFIAFIDALTGRMSPQRILTL